MNIIDKIAHKISEWTTLISPAKHDWYIVKERSINTEHFRRKVSTGERFGVTQVTQLTYIEQCRNTGKRRAKVVYGVGSIFPDEDIDVTKAELIIDGKL
jgi:hypothetical protein